MELVQKELIIERIVLSETVQLPVAGDVPVPEKRSARSVISAGATAAVATHDVVGDSIVITGSVRIDAVCADASNEYFSFTSSAPFTHSLRCEGVPAGARVSVKPSVQGLNVRPADSLLSFDAALVLVCTAVDTSGLPVMAAIRGIDDVEFCEREVTAASRARIGGGRLRLREEIDASGVASALTAEGYALCDSVTCTPDGALVRGRLMVSALVSDGDSALSQLAREVEFEEVVPVQAFTHTPEATVTLESVALRAVSDDFGIVSVEAVMLVEIDAVEERKLAIPTDAFSPSARFVPKHRRVRAVMPAERICSRRVIREKVALLEGLPSLKRPVFASAQPVVTLAAATGADVTVEGVLLTRLVYESESGAIYSFVEDIPFVATVECDAVCTPDAEVYCTVKAADSGDRWIDVEFTVDMCARLERSCELEALVGFDEEADPPREAKGIIVYVTSPGDSAYDVAKTLRVPLEQVRRCQPGKEAFAGGEKVVVLKP
ncbi:MAG: DUF3794 domain-containing protein [Clostridia bacterium]|nr:DUF3794 domain-containing protein [Clostridia bacterium]